VTDRTPLTDDERKTLDELTRWINEATEIAKAGNLDAVRTAIEQVDPSMVSSLLLVLVMSRVNDADFVEQAEVGWPRLSNN
jgi:hypothetical protein